MSRFRTRWMVGYLLAGIAAWASSQAVSAPDAGSWLRADDFSHLEAHYSDLQSQFRSGRLSAEELRNSFRAFYPTDPELAAKYDGWVKRYPRSYVARLARATYYMMVAEGRRGEKPIAKTSEAGVAGMDDAMTLAIRDFGASIPMDEKPFLSYYNMIEVGMFYGEPGQTRKMYDAAISLAPTFVDTRRRFMLSLAEKWGGSPDLMHHYFDECRQANLPQAQLDVLAAMMYEEEGASLRARGDRAGAEAAYRRAVELQGSSCDECLATNLSGMLFEDRKTDEAVSVLDQYIARHPGSASMLVRRAMMNLSRRHIPEAMADLNNAGDAGDAVAQNQIGVLYLTGVPGFLTPDPPKGVEWLRKAAAQGDPNAQRNLPMAEAMLAARPPPK